MKQSTSQGTNIIDPIHGSIAISRLELKIIDSPPFQRLRKIKQLGNVHLVFPGATHTRFSHSLGVMHIAGLLFDAMTREKSDLIDSDEGKRIRERVRLAALLHDVGHGPFSHQFEQFLKSKKFNLGDLSDELKIPDDWRVDATDESRRLSHEDVSFGIIKYLFEQMALEKDFGFSPQDLCSLLDSKIKPSANFIKDLEFMATHNFESDDTEGLRQCLKSILSGEIDADRLDYLERDSLFCGCKITSVDIAHILNSISLKCDDAGRFYIHLKPNAVSAVEQLLISRKMMFDQVYTHHVNAAFDGMLVDLMSDYLKVKKPLTYKWYIGLTDDIVEQNIQKHVTNIRSLDDLDLKAKFFLTRTTLKKVATRVCNKIDEDKTKYELGSVWKIEEEDRDVIPFKMKDFTRLDRDKEENDSSLIKVPSEYDVSIDKPKSVNLVSAIFQSSLWRMDTVKLVVFEGLKKSAEIGDLTVKLKLLELTTKTQVGRKAGVAKKQATG